MTRPPDLFSRLLVPTDFSDSAADAISRATYLPLASEARITLLHVLPPSTPARWHARIERDARRSLDGLAAQATAQLEASGRRDVGVTVVLADRAQPHVEIIRRSRALDADLVVLGRHGARPVRDLFTGSTAMRVARMGDTPLLVVGRPASGPYARAMLATAGDDTASRLVGLVAKTVGREARVTLLAAYDVPGRGLAYEGKDAHPTEFHEQCRREAADVVEEFVAHHRAAGIEWLPVLRLGPPGRVILEVASEAGADLIVMGTHGRPGIAHALLGSVAEGVLQRAPCDVLVARPTSFSFEQP